MQKFLYLCTQIVQRQIMIRIEDIKNFYFLGIGGIGMSALARYFHHRGYRVADMTVRRLR